MAFPVNGKYCERVDLEAVFGKENIVIWADLDDTRIAFQITNRINTAIAYATSEVEDSLRGSLYVIPLVEKTGGSNSEQTIRTLCATIAGIWLYESRGTEDIVLEGNRVFHRLTALKMAAMNKLRGLKALQMRIDFKLSTDRISPHVRKEIATIGTTGLTTTYSNEGG
jgi:phage gp36-like protein